jgi:sugar phosphate isomerase/epimerase
MPQLAAQLYTLRDFCKTPADIAAAMKKVAAIGYKAVQASALGPIDPKELRKILDDNGLVCCATHKSLDQFRAQKQAILDEHAALSCKYTAIGGFFPKGEDFTEATWKNFIAEYNTLATSYKQSGLHIGYHNHSHELARAGAKTAWQMLYDDLNADVWIEVDTYWVQQGGGDPCFWIEKAAGRIPCVHLKDMAVKTDRTQLMAEVGSGNLNWAGILASCKKAGVEWYIVEQDKCNGRDPFTCLAESYAFLKSMGMS